MVVYQLKEQIALPQASLIPGYRLPHLITTLVMTLPNLVAMPVVASVGLGLPILPLLSLNVVFCALVAWAIYRNSGVAMMVALGCWLAPAAPQVHTLFLDRFITDHSLMNSLAALPVLAIGVAGFVLVAWRLLTLREEMPEYPQRVMANQSPFSLYSGGTQTVRRANYDRWWCRWSYVSNERKSQWNAASPVASFWRRVMHRRAAYTNWRMTLQPVLMFTLLFAFWNILLSPNMLNLAGPLTFIVPAITAFVQQYTRWPMLGYESLRPAKRRDFVLENAAAFFLHGAQVWLTMVVVLVAMMAATQPELLRGDQLWKVVAISAISQGLTMPVAWWLLRIRVPTLVFGIAIFWGAMFAPFVAFSKDIFSVPLSWIAGGVAAVLLLGALIILDAYRRWMRLDLA